MSKRDEERLRRRISELEIDHAKQIKAKNEAIEDLRAGVIFELGQAYPSLPTLIRQLRLAALYASVLKSPTGDGRSGAYTRTPLDQGRSTIGDRSRLKWIDDQLSKITQGITDRLVERGPLPDKGPQCWNPECVARSWPQPFEAEACGSCHEPFGRYRPLNDLTRIRPSTKRCWIRGCPSYAKTEQCEHTAA